MTDSPAPGSAATLTEADFRGRVRVPYRRGERTDAPSPFAARRAEMEKDVRAAITADSFENFMARVGTGGGNAAGVSEGGLNNVSAFGTYGFNPITRNRQLLEWMYRSSWVIGKIVDTVPQDMCRAGVNVRGKLTPDALDALHRGASRMALWTHIEAGETWARLYGGCLLVALIEGQDMSTPLNIDTVDKGQFKGIIALDRWMVQPSFGRIVQDLGPDLGKPMFYYITANATALQGKTVHYSRVVRLDGRKLPFWQAQAENFWGMSEIERIHDRLLAYDSTTQGAAQLVYKAYLRTYKVEGLRDIIAAGEEALAGLLMQMEMIRAWQTNEGLTLMDAKDSMEFHQYSFGGLSDVLSRFGEQLAGAADIPLVRMFGQSPAGFSTGDTDLQNYYDLVKAMQNSRILNGVTFFYELLYRSEIGGKPPKDFGIEFVSLWQMSDKERADVAEITTRTIIEAVDGGLIDAPRGATELMNASDRIGLFGSITEDEIETLRANPPDPEGDVPKPEDDAPRDRDPEPPEPGNPEDTQREKVAA